MYPTICTHHKLHNNNENKIPIFPEYISQKVTEYDVKHLRHTTMENMIAMVKVDTSDLTMIITWAIDISFQSPKLKWASWIHTTPCIVMIIKGNRRTSGMLDTPPQDTPSVGQPWKLISFGKYWLLIYVLCHDHVWCKVMHIIKYSFAGKHFHIYRMRKHWPRHSM